MGTFLLLPFIAVAAFVVLVKVTAKRAPSRPPPSRPALTPETDTEPFATRTWRPRSTAATEYRLEWSEFAMERGATWKGHVVVRVEDGQRLSSGGIRPQGKSWTYHLFATDVAGEAHREDAMRGPEFDPGRLLQLVPDPKNKYDPECG